MKIFKCKIRETDIREGILVVRAPNEQLARDPAWVDYARETCGTYDDFRPVTLRYEMLEVTEAKTLSDIPKEWKSALPHYHPAHEPKDERELKEILEPEQADNKAWVQDEIEQFETVIKMLKEKIAKRRAFLGAGAKKSRPVAKRKRK